MPEATDELIASVIGNS